LEVLSNPYRTLAQAFEIRCKRAEQTLCKSGITAVGDQAALFRRMASTGITLNSWHGRHSSLLPEWFRRCEAITKLALPYSDHVATNWVAACADDRGDTSALGSASWPWTV